MTKTPEQMAEQWANGESDLWFADISTYTEGHKDAVKQAFLAGYKAAKDQVADASKVMNSSNNSNGWISVKERLPNIGDPCLVTCHEERYTIAEYDGIKWTTLNSIAYYHPTVTHWMPLPEAPKGEA